MNAPNQLTHRLNGFGKTAVYKVSGGIRRIKDKRLTSQIAILFLIYSLLIPVWLVGNIQSVNAQSSVAETSSIRFAPPVPFKQRTDSYIQNFSTVNSTILLIGTSATVWDWVTSWFYNEKNADSSSRTNSPNSENSYAAKRKSLTNSMLVSGTPYDLAKARLEPVNATGGTNLYSRNFSWGTGLAGLPGRSGLDAGFGLSYNSLMWLKDGSNMVLDPDISNVSPGFRMGFPVIEPSYSDTETGQTTFLMVTPSGGRVEFRQVGSSSKYETPDSGYGELTLNSSSSITVRGTDGTQVDYTFLGGAFFVSQIKDANGNYITVSNDSAGYLQSVTDTLGRVITVNYTGGYPTSVTQMWKDTNGAGSNVTYTYATLSYTNITVSPSFDSSLTISGVVNNSSVKVLDKVTYSNGAYTKFDYNNFGQVWKVSNYAADNHKLSHIATNLDAPGTSLLDVPRFSSTKLWTENFNQDTYGVEQEVVIPNTFQTGQSYSVPGASGTGTLVQITAPDGTVSKTYFSESGWQEGLPVVTEDWESSVRQRWTWTNWTQDNTAVIYILNPRVTESKVGDPGNTKRTTVSYHLLTGNISNWGLVNEVKVYDTDQTTVLKKSVTNYDLSTTYTNRRIIGLPSETLLYDQSNALMSKVTFNYDEGNFNDSTLEQNISPTQHDNTNYGSSFIAGRGNPTSTTRWDTTQPTNSALAVTSSIKYNTAGSPVAQVNPLSNQIKLSYADSFNDSVNRSSYAYPTKVYDPAGNYSEVKYRFDIGANVWAKSPAPAGNTSGKETTRTFDSLGRMEKQTIVNTGAYTRYEYPTNSIQSKVYATVTDVNSNNTGDTADEVLTESWTDGAGRVRQTRTEHPGSTGGYSATLAEYDIMGRAKRSSVPTEVNSSWTPAGDDATRGFIWTENEYDWKGRTTRVINPDGTDKLYEYDGCGCAGGQVTTIKGEEVIEKDWNGNTISNLGRRTQKVYADILGRAYKTEVLNWNNTVYSSAQTTFNGRDQATQVTQYAGTTSSSTNQTMTLGYDGHGRLKTRHRPEQNTATNTTYNYNTDDSISSVSDARGAAASYTYNSRGLPTQIAYTVPTGVAATPTVNFSYDNIGNRTQMTDGMGTADYTYNQLSQMTSETRTFTDYLPNAPLSGNKFKLEYAYTISGQLKSYKEAYGQQINYTHDKAGRLSTVTGATSYGGVTSYADNPQYRAWGGLKHLAYGTNPAEMDMTYNNRLQAKTFVVNYNSSNLINKEYTYQGGGELRYIDDKIDNSSSSYTNVHDRSYRYDQIGRITEARTGAEARGGTAASYDELPYHEDFTYDALGHTTSFFGTSWDKALSGFNATYTNNRETNHYYDAEGNQTSGGALSYTYDANSQITFSTGEYIETTSWYAGDGQEIKRSVRNRPDEASSWSAAGVIYFIKSSVMGGQIINEVKSDGAKVQANVLGAGTIIARQTLSGTTEQVEWEHREAAGATVRYSTTSNSGGGAEIDAVGNDVGLFKPFEIIIFPKPGGGGGSEPPPPSYTSPGGYGSSQSLQGSGGCTAEGVPIDCALVSNEVAVQCRNNDCGPQTRINPRTGNATLSSPFRAYNDGRSGYWVQEERTSATGVEGGELGNKVKFTVSVFKEVETNSNPIINASWKIQGNSPKLNNGTPEQKEIFDNAIDEVNKRLGTKEEPSECAKLFGGYKNAVKLLNQTKFVVENIVLPDGRHGLAATFGKKVALDPTREFFNDKSYTAYFDVDPSVNTIAGRKVSLSGVIKLAFILIHELGHRGKIYNKDDDKDLNRLSQANNNEKLRKACFSDITGLEGVDLLMVDSADRE